jgi:hypothetical protein
VIEDEVHLSESGVDRVVRHRRYLGVVDARDRNERSEESGKQLDQQDAELEAEWRQAVAAAGTEALNKSFRAELA